MEGVDVKYHEAGHAVVAHLVGCTLIRVSARPNGAELGHTEQSRPRGRYRHFDALTVTYAGHAATAIRNGTPPPLLDTRAPWPQVIDGDFLVADSIVKRMHRRINDGEDVKRRCRVRAQRLLSMPAHWRAVEAIVTGLSEHNVLDGSEAHRIITASIARGL
ncbi:MAG: hypothetical protein EPO26_18085 [Chloroflexota bacterium]|nr:MAG: hypothetical protein EPO26_18085 [Chloroflexota bacterium]